MTERIIYCHKAYKNAFSGQSYEKLGSIGDDIWASVKDRSLLVIKDRHFALPLLYFSKKDYEQAIRKLSQPEINNVISERLEHWSPTALDEAINWLYDREKQCLTLSALGRISNVSDATAILDEYFNRTLRLLANINGERRYDVLSLAEMFVLVLESESELINENMLADKVAQSIGNTAEMENFARTINKRVKYAQDLSNVLKRLGRPEYVNSLPYIDLEQGLFVSPVDRDLISGLMARYAPFVQWKDGLVTALPIRKLPDLENQGKSVVVLYLGSGNFLEDLYELTSAQLDREFEERLQSKRGASLQAINEHLNDMHIEHILLKYNLLKSVSKKDPTLCPLPDAQLKEETTSLKSRLALYPIGLARVPEPGDDAVIMLKRTDQDVTQDAKLFSALCGRERKHTLQSRIKAFLEVKKQDSMSLDKQLEVPSC